MGCANSKQTLCRKCQGPCSPVPRSHSMHNRHPPDRQADSYHVVALTSSTLGSLRLDPIRQNDPIGGDRLMNGPGDNDDDTDKRKKTFSMGLNEAKSWSEMIEEHIPKTVVPKTPIRTPPGEPETIDAWELMEGLEDATRLRPPHHHLRSFSFHVSPNPNPVSIASPFDPPKSKLQQNGNSSPTPLRVDSNSNAAPNSIQIKSQLDRPKSELQENGNSSPKPFWVDPNSNAESVFSEPNLQENGNSSPKQFRVDSNTNAESVISEPHQQENGNCSPKPFWVDSNSNPNAESVISEPHLRENGNSSPRQLWVDSNSNANAESIITEFDPDVISTFRKALEDLPPANPFYLKPLGSVKNQDLEEDKIVNGVIASEKCSPIGKHKVVLYFTSLRGVRKTYEDCCHVRVILKGLGIRVDERDVSMHSGFKEELKELLGDGFNRGGLPRVFIGENYIGSAEEIRRMHEEGRLEKVVEGCERGNDGGYGSCAGGGVCEVCGDIRFVPCETCSGSCKVYYEEDCSEDYEEDEYGFHRCPDCNENGLVRCPICCD